MYVKVVNIHDGSTIVARELNDFMWELGYRMIGSVSNLSGAEYLKLLDDEDKLYKIQHGVYEHVKYRSAQ